MKSQPPNPDASGLSLPLEPGLTLRRAWIELDSHRFEAELATPSAASRWVVFPRWTRYTAYLARHFNRAGLATMRAALDLQSAPPEAVLASLQRLQAALAWLRHQPEYAGEPIGLFTGGDSDVPSVLRLAGSQASSLAGLALWGSAKPLRGYAGPRIDVPTLLLARATDRRLRRWMRQHLAGPGKLTVVPGLDTLLDDPDVLHRLAEAALPWFEQHGDTGLLVPATPRRSDKRWRRKLAAASLVVALGAGVLPGTALASITVTLGSDGKLTITGDSADDTIEVSTDSDGFILINGDFLLIDNLSVRASRVTAICVKGGGGNDRIDLSGVTSSNFTELEDVDLDGEGGNDTVIGTGKSDTVMGSDGDDLLDGGLDSDSLGGGLGLDTLLGGDGDDTLVGGTETGPGEGDLLGGGDGQDSMLGGFGFDTLGGGLGLDTLLGEEGDDLLEGGLDTDSIMGGLGLDTLLGVDDDDTLDGGEGDDSLDGGSGSDSIMGGLGLDTLLGVDDDDLLDGGLDTDSIMGGLGLDTLLGVDGDDTLDGGEGDDSLDGGSGSDSLMGGLGLDTLLGVDDDDLLDGGLDSDSIMGGLGLDTLLGVDGDDTLDGGEGDDTLLGGLDSDSLMGGLGLDTLLGEDGDDTLDGGLDSDSLMGGLGLDTLLGVDGDDTLDGGEGDDMLDGGLDSDSIMGGLGLDTLLGVDGDDTLDGGEGDDMLEGDDTVSGVPGNDSLFGGSGLDTIFGFDGFDTLLGGDDDDMLEGGAGDDTLDGGLGIDTILGGGGDDTITGGQGADSIDAGEGNDEINEEEDDDDPEKRIEVISAGPGSNLIRIKPKKNIQQVISGGVGEDSLCIDMDGLRFFEEPTTLPGTGKITFDEHEPICFDDIEEVIIKNPSPTAIEEEPGEDAVSGEDATVEVPGTHLLPGVYPNPFNGQARFEVAVSERQHVRVVLYDVLGREVGQLHEGTLDPFRLYNFTVDGARLTSGLYVYVVTGERFRDTGTMLVVK